MSAWEDIGNKPKETYAEALARWNASQAAPVKTEQQRAEAEVERREKMRRHDATFAGDFISLADQRLISKSLLRNQGYSTEADVGFIRGKPDHGDDMAEYGAGDE